MNRLKLILTLATLLCGIQNLLAQKYSFIEYNTNEGLVQSQVKYLYQDSRGYIWCGTITGASKFDGRHFENYTLEDGLVNSQVSCITELSDGTIVLGSTGGISTIKNQDVSAISFPEGLETAVANDIVMADDRLWIGTSEGVLEFDGQQCIKTTPDHPGFSANVKKIIFESKSHWILVSRDKVSEWKNGEVSEMFKVEKGVALFDAELDDNGILWLASNDPGLIGIGQNMIYEFGIEDNLISSSVSEIMVDNQGDLWLSTLHGISRYSNEVIRSYGQSSGLPAEKINMTLEDDEGNIWIATDGRGIVKFTGENFEIFTQEDGICSDGIMSVTEDTLGGLWFASYDNGICRFQDRQFETFNLDKYTGNNRRFWSNFTDSEGQLWFGSSNGLVLYSNGQFQDKSDGLLSNKVLCLYEDTESNLWIGTTKGLNVVSNLSINEIEVAEEAPKFRVRGITQDSDGVLWLATRSGVWSKTNEGFISHSKAPGLEGRKAYSVETDLSDRVWVGTDQGVIIKVNNEWRPLKLPGTSDANHINFLKYAEDQMWIGTNGGLFRVQISEELTLESYPVDHYSLQDGLTNLETNLNSVFVDSKNNLWFGTANGLVRTDLDRGVKSPQNYKPRIHFTGIDVNLEAARWEDYKVQVDNYSGLPTELEVPFKDNSLTFHFNGISTSYPSEVRYQFMLDGIDNDWQPITKAEFAHYSNLPFAEYTFKVRAIGKASTQGDIVAFSFSVLPPFWFTWWFIALSFVVLSTLIWVIYRRRKHALMMEMAKEKFEYRSKMLALEQQTLNSSLNRHFIFNALNSIQYYINRKDRLAANKYLSAFAKLIRMNLDSSQMNLTSLREEIERLELYLELEKMRFTDKFEYNIQIGNDVDIDNVKVPAMLLQPFLENSIWHGILPKEEKGMIQVDINRSNGSIELIIRDDGIGIETSLKKKQEDGNHLSKGMKITSGRIELIKKMTAENVELLGPYEITDDSEGVSGTEVKIILPANFHEIYPN